MSFAHLRRIVISMVFIAGIFVLAIVVDGAMMPVYDTVVDAGVLDGPFGAPIEYVPSVAYLIIGLLLFGVCLWILVGPIQRTRVDQERRRLR